MIQQSHSHMLCTAYAAVPILTRVIYPPDTVRDTHNKGIAGGGGGGSGGSDEPHFLSVVIDW